MKETKRRLKQNAGDEIENKQRRETERSTNGGRTRTKHRKKKQHIKNCLGNITELRRQII